MANKLDAALALAAKGFFVFPLTPNAKAPPLLSQWPEVATTYDRDIETWWAQWPDANIGIHCEGLIVIDVDPKKGGNDSLKLLEINHGLPETLTTRTPTGGRHLYYRSAVAVPNGVDCLGKGIDTRSNRGYVVAPGSEVEAGRYRFEQDKPIANAPAWLVERCGVARGRTETTPSQSIPDAGETVVQRALEWLKTAERSVKGEGGDQAAYRVACKLRELGVSEAQCAELMRSEAWDHGCGWRAGWLEAKPIRSAYRYAQNEAGGLAAAPEDFPVVTVDNPPAKVDKTRVQRLSAFATNAAKGPGYLVKGLLQRRSYAELYGAPGEGKTFIGLDISYHVAANQPWMGCKVHSGVVLYLAYEGTGGMVKRAQALRQKYGNEDIPLFIAGAAFNLREQAGRHELRDVILSLPEKPVLIVIDTFARALMGGDENSAQDVGAFNQAVAALIESTGACVMIVHHSGKNKAAGARGSSALLGALDTELEVDGCQVTARKQRDVEAGAPTGFKLVPVVVGLDEDGDTLTSCVVEQDTIAASPKGKLSGNPRAGFDVLCEIRPDNAPVTAVEWKDACKEFLGEKRVDQRFYELKKILRQKKFIQVDDEGMITRSMT